MSCGCGGTPLDYEAYELALAIFRFDPKKHPRGLRGRFIDVLDKMEDGDEVDLPNGTAVRKESGRFRVSGGVAPARTASAREAAAAVLGKGGAGAAGEPIDVGGDVALAANMLQRGRRVRLEQPKQVSTLLEELRARVQEAKAKGQDAPIYDLCKVSVPGTNLFCAQSKGIPRIKMPQLSGRPQPGTPAAKLKPSAKGEVDLGPAFIEHLRSAGVPMRKEEEKAANLRASQDELNGAKVAGIAGAMEEGKVPPARLFVSEDDYIVDGHHRWAATVGNDAQDDVLGDLTMPVLRVDMNIIDLLDEANRFTHDMGIASAGV